MTDAEDRLVEARRTVEELQARAAPTRKARRVAERELASIEADHRKVEDQFRRARPWRRHRLAGAFEASSDAVAAAKGRFDAAVAAHQPHADAVEHAVGLLRRAEREVDTARLRARLEHFAQRELDRDPIARDRGPDIGGLGR